MRRVLRAVRELDAAEVERGLEEHRRAVQIVGLLLSVAFHAAFPRLAWRLHWRGRLSLRGHLIWIACHLGIVAALLAFRDRVQAIQAELHRPDPPQPSSS